MPLRMAAGAGRRAGQEQRVTFRHEGVGRTALAGGDFDRGGCCGLIRAGRSGGRIGTMFDAEARATEDVEDAGSAALRCAGISSAELSADGNAVPRAPLFSGHLRSPGNHGPAILSWSHGPRFHG